MLEEEFNKIKKEKESLIITHNSFINENTQNKLDSENLRNKLSLSEIQLKKLEKDNKMSKDD